VSPLSFPNCFLSHIEGCCEAPKKKEKEKEKEPKKKNISQSTR
jgi:hypothetical protein